tara:strand:- start:16 stop:282 length:267 start_codon:yes stop_codon:yes gene_type:complete
MSELQNLMVTQVWILEIEAKFINVGTAIRRENIMKQLAMVLSMMVILTACTKLEFDGFDPTTATVRWFIKQNFSIEKDQLQVTKNATR